MAWIKMRTDLKTHPKVVRMSSALKADRLRVIGGLWSVWGTFDTHSVDGTLVGYSFFAIDEDLGWPGFAEAMAAVNWLVEVENEGLEIPEFDEHNGASAKRRAGDSKRKGVDRKSDPGADGSWNGDGQMSASDADKKQTREELDKRKSKKVGPPNPPAGGSDIGPASGFVEFWDAWPRSDRKGGKAECVKVWEEKALEIEAPAIVAHVCAMAKTEGWTKQGGEFVPAPAVYLRGRRWDGAEMPQPAGRRPDAPLTDVERREEARRLAFGAGGKPAQETIDV